MSTEASGMISHDLAVSVVQSIKDSIKLLHLEPSSDANGPLLEEIYRSLDLLENSTEVQFVNRTKCSGCGATSTHNHFIATYCVKCVEEQVKPVVTPITQEKS